MLKLIPTEDEPSQVGAKSSALKIKTKINKKPLEKNEAGDPFFLTLFRHIGNFLEKGKEYTIQQIDDLIMQLQRTVLRLQHKKHTILKQHEVQFKKRKIR